MNLDRDFFQVSKLSEDQKKKVFTKNRRTFFPNSSKDQKIKKESKKKGFHQNGRLFFPTSNENQKTTANIIQRSDADQSQIIGGWRCTP